MIVKSLDPRIERAALDDESKIGELNVHEHFETYEVFQQVKRGTHHQHAPHDEEVVVQVGHEERAREELLVREGHPQRAHGRLDVRLVQPQLGGRLQPAFVRGFFGWGEKG